MSERRRSLLMAAAPTVVAACALGGLGVGWLAWGRPERFGELSKIRVALDRVRERYYAEVPVDRLVDDALRGMASRLDPYCEYLTAQEWREFRENQVEGKFGGVGLVIEPDPATGFVQVFTPLEDSPAFAADILPGDQIREVDGKSLRGLALKDVVQRIKGLPGTKVALTIARKGRDPFVVALTRGIVQVKAVRSQMLPDGIGYIRISDFTEMMELFDAEVKKLQDQGLRAMVIDLRFNNGGLLEECVTLADRFLDEGVIVTTRGRLEDDRRELVAKKGDSLPAYPLAILVNERTASACEVFAGALKDHGRGVLVGTRTYGKGLIQTPIPLPDGAFLKLTTARYYTPSGVCVQREEGQKDYGLEPDYRVEMSSEEYEQLLDQWRKERILKGVQPKEPSKFVDYQLEAALEVLRAGLENREAKVEARVLHREEPSEN